jgi:capsular exopolysaccharide synthesis family protein
VRARIWIVLLVAALAVGAALALDLSATQTYAASANVLLNIEQSPPSVFSNTQSGSVTNPARELDSQIQVMKSGDIDHNVRRALGHDAAAISSVSMSGVGQTDVIQVTVESPSPSVAHRAADLYAQTYVTTQREQAVNSLLATGTELQKRLNGIQAQLNTTPPGPQHDALAAQYQLFTQSLNEVQVNASVQQGGAQVVDRGTVPVSPVKPQPVRDVALALALGLLLGVGLAFLAEYLDDKTHTIADVARYGHGLTVLAEIPAVTSWRDRKSAHVVALEDPSSSAAEAYRSLRTSLQIITLRRDLKALLVTSPTSAEGKTTTVANLGVAMARAGRRVVLIDLDLRRPRLGRFFRLDSAAGVTSVLVGDVRLADALHEVQVAPGVPPLQLLTSGPVPPNPSELLGASRVAELLATLQRTADLVIIDSPPLLPVTDALVLSGRVDGVLLVVGADITRRRHLARSVDLLGQAEAPLLGAVLNGSARNRDRYSDYEYSSEAVNWTAPVDPNGSRKRASSVPTETNLS